MPKFLGHIDNDDVADLECGRQFSQAIARTGFEVVERFFVRRWSMNITSCPSSLDIKSAKAR